MDSRSRDNRYKDFSTFFIIFALIPRVTCQESCTDPCSCNNQDNQPLFCNKRGFEPNIFLSGQNTTLKIDGMITHRVTHIDLSTLTIKTVREDLFDDGCSVYYRKLNTYFPDEYTTLFYPCNLKDWRVPRYEFICRQRETENSKLSTMPDVVYIKAEGSICSDVSVRVPIVLYPFNHVNWGELEKLLRDGAWVEYYENKSDDDDDILKIRLLIGFGTALGSIVVMLVLFYFYLRRKKRKDAALLLSRNISSYPSSRTVDFEKSNNLGVHLFSYAELEEATHNFDSARELGDGGFGTVYYGKLRDGRAVAVKRLYEHNFKRVEQFLNEVEILTRLRHTNLVSLYGCTSRHSRELLLVYEYVANGTVADHLHGDRARPGKLPLSTRLNIAAETAHALAYLHASDIVHRDVKTNNILLDEHFRVKVADFGLSRLFPSNATHVSTAPQGTPGYVDPDYRLCYQLTDKSDVYSFGVVLIELISSLPAVDITRHRHEINLATLAISRIQSKAVHELVDPSFGFATDEKVRRMVEAMAELAFGCLQDEKDLRPSMAEILEILRRMQSDIGEMETVTLSPDSVAMDWNSSNNTTPNPSV